MLEDNRTTQAVANGTCGTEALAEWFGCWDTIEALARDASRLHEKCGTNCSPEELQQWRERVLAQVKAELANEEGIFEALSAGRQAEADATPQATLASTA